MFRRFLSTSVTSFPEFDKHSHVLCIYDEVTGLRGYVAVHRGGLSEPTFGATRLFEYANDEEALRDALRLSRLMSYKSAMAGLPYGGAKAVLIKPKNLNSSRTKFLRSYAEKINVLRGGFITGTDVGLSADDLRVLSKYSPYFVGNGVDSEIPAAEGVVRAMRLGVKHLFGEASLKGRSVAIQGIGKMGSSVLDEVYSEGAVVYYADVDERALAKIRRKYPRAMEVPSDIIHTVPADVYSPCAMAYSLNKKTVAKIRARLVCGAANNQLATDEVGDQLHNRGILYLPDYVVNAGGLITVTDEYEHGGKNSARVRNRLRIIESNVGMLLNRSKRTKIPAHRIANIIAEKIFNKML